MKLLIYTQKINKNDQVLGFFHDWVLKLSYKFDNVFVVCIEKGEYDLPNNVEVIALGKQFGINKIKYIVNFFKILYKIKGKYDRVFVHMNQEYILLGGIYWRLSGVPIYLWRNHLKGNFLTDLSVYMSNKVFYTSKSSYTAKFKNSIEMPVGIDTDLFKPIDGVVRRKYSVGMVGRISPVKNIELAIKAIKILIHDGVQVNLTIIGPVLDKDKKYFNELNQYIRKMELQKYVTFKDGVSFNKLPVVYSELEIVLNLTQTGSFDKTIVEATSCGAMPLVTNDSLNGLLPEVCITKNSEMEVVQSIKRLLQAGEQVKIHKDLQNFVYKNSLDTLLNELMRVLG